MAETIRALIIDDEQRSITSLKWELENFADVEIVGSTTDPMEGIDLIQDLKPRLVFLDIEMPVLNGFDLIQKFDVLDFEIIFTTAYDKFAVRAFEVSAIDYLLKPINEEDLSRALEKVKSKTGIEYFQRKMEVLFKNLRTDDPFFDNIVIPTNEGLEFLEAKGIVRCESSGNYTWIYMDNNDKHLVSKTLKEIEGMLDSRRFYRVHHSHLVNISFIKKYLKGKDGTLVLKNGELVPVSRTKKSNLLDRI
ncbi:MAG: LytTR family DNA-binding domain-containing protein [Bacteroidota bacterium]